MIASQGSSQEGREKREAWMEGKGGRVKWEEYGKNVEHDEES